MNPGRTVYLADSDSRSDLINVHVVVIHDEGCSTAQACSRLSSLEKLVHARSCPDSKIGSSSSGSSTSFVQDVKE